MINCHDNVPWIDCYIDYIVFIVSMTNISMRQKYITTYAKHMKRTISIYIYIYINPYALKQFQNNYMHVMYIERILRHHF